ncbi:MAG: hypothetical protein WED34_20600 [Planctomycetales bacterium]
MRTKLVPACLAATLLLGSAAAFACSVPVFRYALERWQADPYVLLVFHEGPLSAEQRALVEKFRGFAPPDPDDPQRITPVNLMVETFDVKDRLDPFVEEIWKRNEAQAGARANADGLPWMVLRFPWESQLNADVWAGPFTEANLDRLLVSPKRNELATRILDGDSAVWLVIGSGDAERDAQVAKDLEAELRHVEKLAVLPEMSPEDQQFLSPAGPKLQIKFSVLPVDRNDPQESFLVGTLLAAARGEIENAIAGIDLQLTDRRARLAEVEQDPEADPEALARRKEGFANITKRYEETKADLRKGLADLDGPVVVPVIGRGRAIRSLYGEAIVPAAYSSSCGFLLGPCSCEIKGDNPGFDLLISADWMGRISGEFTAQQALPPLTGPFATISAAIPSDGATNADGGSRDGDGAASAGDDATPSEPEAAGESSAANAGPSAAAPASAAPAPSSTATASVESESVLLRNVAVVLIGGVVVVLGAGMALQWKRRG